MNAAIERSLRKTAIGTSDDVFASYQMRKAHQPLGYQLRMFHNVCSVADNAGRDCDVSLVRPYYKVLIIARVS